MRRPFVAGNWKMNTNGAQAEQLAAALAQRFKGEQPVEIAVCPPFPYLTRVGSVLAGSAIALGAQNLHPDTKGAFTGEVSPTMLVDCGCKWVIVGHSERRHLLGESDNFIRRKLVGALNAGLHVIFCIGETLAQRQANQTEMIIETQLVGGVEGLAKDKLARVVVAYEPVWAIGTGHNATPDQAQQVHHFVRDWLDGQIGAEPAQSMRIVYGGSVKPDNAKNLQSQPDVDGSLVGGASLNADDFTAIVQAAVRGR
jgi:triosephosphate isomerase (TIM)